MGTLHLLKEVEREEQNEVFVELPLQIPAVILDFTQKFQANLQAKKVTQWAVDALEVLKVLVNDYERLMQELALQITPEQLSSLTDLSAQDQIKEDIRRLQDIVSALESKVLAKKGLSLEQAFEELKQEEGTELSAVAIYLEKNEYALFATMMKIIRWASVASEAVERDEYTLLVNCLMDLGAFDTANAVVFFDSRS